MKTIFLLLLTTVVVFSACGRSSNQTEEAKTYNNNMVMSADYMPAPSEEAANKSEPVSDLDVKTPMLTKTANIEIEIKDSKETTAEVEKLVKSLGGYISSQNQNSDNYAITNSCNIRVPNNKFDELLENLEKLGVKTVGRRIDISDVTEEYVDLDSRVKTKKAVENQYRALLAKATKMSDILEVEEKLRVIREETEVAEGRMRYLKNRVNLSTIDFTYKQILDYKYVPESGPGFFARIWKSMVNGWTNTGDFIIDFIAFWPYLILIFIFRIIYKKWKLNLWFQRKKE
ncbi:MAG: DUF4349 domain-containing protein [Bacteroidetes bacterium]|nr:DUF4349 domain-containing protein [Bacteroidota bacterium]